MNGTMREVFRNGIGLLAVVVMIGAFLASSAPAQNLSPCRLITSSGITSPITLNILIGKYLGYYEKEGLDFELGSMGQTGTGPMVQGVTQGRFEFATIDATSFMFLDIQGEDLPIKAFYCYVREQPEAVAVPDASPIKSVNDLKGKKIGIRDVSRSRYIKAIMATSGIDPEGAEYIPVSVGAGPAVALRQGEVHALSMFDIELARVESMGIKLRYLPLSEKWITIQGPLVITNEKMIKEHPDRVIGFGRATAKSTLFTLTNVEAAVRIFYKMYPQAMLKGVTPEEAIKDTIFTLNARLPKLTIENRKVNKWGYLDPESWNLTAEFMMEGLKGKIRKPLATFYTNQFIDEINKFDPAAVINQAKSYKIN